MSHTRKIHLEAPCQKVATLSCKVWWSVPLLAGLYPQLRSRYPFAAGWIVRWQKDIQYLWNAKNSDKIKSYQNILMINLYLFYV